MTNLGGKSTSETIKKSKNSDQASNKCMSIKQLDVRNHPHVACINEANVAYGTYKLSRRTISTMVEKRPRFPSSVGRGPVRSLNPKMRYCKSYSHPSSVGIELVSSLSIKFRNVKEEMLPSSVGMDPNNKLSPKSKCRKDVRYHSSLGMVPSKLVPAKSI